MLSMPLEGIHREVEQGAPGGGAKVMVKVTRQTARAAATAVD